MERTINPGKRYRQIVRILAHHGFGFFVSDLGLGGLLGFYRRARIGRLDESDLSHLPERIRLTLENLGPTFIKVGQFLSTRSDVIPEEIVQELKKLQESAAPISSRLVKKVLEDGWGKQIEEVLLSFDETPLGSASIGQVHRAVLLDGTEVALKVRRPDIIPSVQADLMILKDLARLAEERWGWAKQMNLIQVIKEFADALHQEVDYRKEAINILRIARQKQDKVRVPLVYRELSSSQILVMEYIEGIRFDEGKILEEHGGDPQKISEHLIHVILRQMLEFGYYHADPHPGNIRILAPNTILFLDFGLVGRLGREMREALSSIIISLMMDDNQGIADVLVDMGAVSGQVDRRALRRDIERLRQEYYGIPLEEINLGEALEALWKVAAKHQVHVPPNMALLARTVMTLEGVIRGLVPHFNILSVAEPYAWRLLGERLHPVRLVKEGWSIGRQGIHDVITLPREIRTTLEHLEGGKISVNLTPEWQQRISQLEQNQRGLQKILLGLFLAMIFGILLLAPAPSWLGVPQIPYLVDLVYGAGVILFLWIVGIFFFN